MLYYIIPKIANYKDKNDDCAIVISYHPQESEKHMTEEELIKYKRKWIATQLNLPELFVIPSSKEEYMRMGLFND